MDSMLYDLIKRLEEPQLSEANVLSWGSPVPSFGDISLSRVATLGLNPSNREFVDSTGRELDGTERRFHTLKSLSLSRWSRVDKNHVRLMTDSCRQYFKRNPYNGWFRVLDWLIGGTKASFYGNTLKACHLDLIPYATACKWTELTLKQRNGLLHSAGDTLGLLLRDSPVRVLILNGQTVTDNLQKIAGTTLQKDEMAEWLLPRNTTAGVKGFAYKGYIRSLGGVALKNEILVLGFNHNIQSSFGVTSQVKAAIRNWITRVTCKLNL